MAISTNGGSNPTSVTYNGKNVTEVWYKSSPTADAVLVWPEQIKKLYKRFNKSNGTMYLRSTPYSGYVEHTGGPVYGENNAYCSPSDIKYVVTEEPIII